ncbi:late embryogenesis abundant protein [Senna tora]|uniref:Late embryogenesis abundant protein n=1 Tax=Senna tora TaxID=362788 RepID=A0A834WR80_9FABA|nr:late embryogenesis abundant protein [Senna tora]
MFHAIRSVRTCPSFSFPRSPNFAVRENSVRFRQVTSASSQTNSTPNMDKPPQNPNEKTGDVMSHSFGEGYATRSDEEGFGGVYGDNDSSAASKIQTDKVIHENHPAYDKTQGSEVKEKEKARHQTNVNN